MVTPGATTVAFAVPSAATVKFGMSPACGPSGFMQAVMLHVRIKVPARRGECRAFAFRDSVHVNGMFARRQTFQIQLDAHAGARSLS